MLLGTTATRANKRKGQVRGHRKPLKATTAPAGRGLIAQHETPQLLAIAASTGGPSALQTILIGLGADFPLPTLVAQHIAHGFVEGMVTWLNRTTPLPVQIARLNLAEPCFPAIPNGTYAQDLILCRNVTIYFDEATTHQLIERFHSTLLPGGWLIVGHAEPQASMFQQLELHNFPQTIVYRKRLDAPLFSPLVSS